jgi:hypothetical protein
MLRNLDVVTNPDNPRRTSRVSSMLGGPALYDDEAVERSAKYEKLKSIMDLLKKYGVEEGEVPTIKEIKSNKSKMDRVMDIINRKR